MQGRASLQFSLADYEGSGGLDATLLRDHTVDGLDSDARLLFHGISENLLPYEFIGHGCKLASRECVHDGGYHLGGDPELAAEAVSTADTHLPVLVRVVQQQDFFCGAGSLPLGSVDGRPQATCILSPRLLKICQGWPN